MASASVPPLLRDASQTKDGDISAVDWVILQDQGEHVCLQPIRTVSRCHIPLSWLQFSPLSGTASRFFSLSSIDVISRFPTLHNGQSALLARDRETEGLCVLEKAGENVYSLLRLKDGLAESNISTAVGESQSSRRDLLSWWQQAKLEYARENDEAQKRPQKRIKLDMTRPAGVSASLVKPTSTSKPLGSSPFKFQGSESIQTNDSVQFFEGLVCQYLDALYVNRTSLAFFAKGPLSRIRVTFTSTTSESLSIQELALFLRSMILSHNALDKKFKEKLPSMADELAMKIYDDEEDMEENAIKKKSRKKKKLKINREGMYPFEEEYVTKWWKGVDETMDANETRDEKVKRRIGDLRVRQTLIQIILLLEIMALESSPLWKQMSGVVGEDTSKSDPVPLKRTKKPLDLSLALDLLVDKLSIWQSVELDAHRPAQLNTGQERSKTWSQDQLGSFCIDVLIPFYKSRVPEKTAQIVKRFGVSSGSPEKRITDSKKSKQVKGESKKDANKKPSRKPLARSTSHSQQISHSRSDSLARSMTDMSMMAPGIKREPSEARSLASIPQLQDKPKPRRDSMASLKHLKSRQISLSSLSVPKDRKRKHEGSVEDELRSAIDGIKKPNRSMIGRQVADEREKLKSLSTNKGIVRTSKGSSGGERRVLGNMENVQVLATPHHNRTKHIHTGPDFQLKLQNNQQDVVTSSAAKPQSREHIPATDLKLNSKGKVQQHVLETPSKGSSRHFTLHNSPGKIIDDSNGVPDSTIKSSGLFNAEAILASSPIIPASSKPAKSYPRYSFGRPLPDEPHPGLTSPLSSRRLLTIPVTPVKKAAM